MLEIYKTVPIMKNLPLNIECICAYDDYIIIGTKQGHLLMYKFETKRFAMNEIKPEIHLLRSNKAFAKKPITQVEAVPDLRILVSLSDNIISVHNLDQITFPLITCVSKTKGATLFVLDVQKQRTLTGEQQCTLRMCVVVRYKLMLFYWKNNDFHELGPDLKVPDVPKTIAWCSQSLCVGFRADYSLIKVVSGEPKELFPTGGKQPEPTVVLLEGNRLALGRDEKTYILNSEGSPILNYPITWSDIPINLVDDSQYLIAVLPSSIIEILTVEPKLFIQKIDLSQATNNKIKHIVKCVNKTGHLLLASSNDVFCMILVSQEQQISQLISENHYELALQVADMWNDNDMDGKRQQMMQKIKNMHAFDLFCKKQYKDALVLFLNLNTEPSQVIGLFPDLLPDDFRNKLEYPSKPPQMQGADLETGLFALIDYLLEVRRNLANSSNSAVNYDSSKNDNLPVYDPKTKYQLKSIIDTTLLKCYLQTNDALVAPLLRLRDNHCHLEETEKALKKHHKYNELIILYQNKGMHKSALDLLYKQSKKANSPLAGYKKTVQYLQHLTHENLDLIFEYANWVLKDHPEEGIQIFTDDAVADMELLPRQTVLDYLQKINSDLIIPYLEHVIFTWNDTNPSFHNSLVHKYREKVRLLLNEYKNSLPESESPSPAGQEPGELGVLRCKLMHFLEESSYYSTETLPTYLLNDGLFEERAVVMGKIGNHKDALVIYIHMLHDMKRAEDYCERMYNKGNPENKDVFLILLSIYLSIPPPNVSEMTQSNKYRNENNLEPNIQAAIDLLIKHSTKIDPLKAIFLLPLTIPVIVIKDFLQSTINQLLVERHCGQIFRNLLLAQRLQVHEQRIRLQHFNKVVVDEHDICRVCQKRIGKSVFVRFVNKDLVHFMCKEKYSSR